MAPTEAFKTIAERHEAELCELHMAQFNAMYAEGDDANSQSWDCFCRTLELGHRHSRELTALRIGRVSENSPRSPAILQ